MRNGTLTGLREPVHRMALLLTLTLAVPGMAAAQSVMLDLGAEVVVLTPGATVALPLTMSVAGDGPSQVLMEVGYPADQMKFLDVAPGFSVEASEAELRAEAKPATGAEGVLAVSIKTAKTLPPGTLALMKFVFTSAARPGTEIPIKNLSRSAKTAGGADMQARGTEGLITLVEPPAPCFFYMH